MSKLNENIVSLIKEYINENGIEYRTNYSGRCMFDKKCFGIIGGINTLVNFVMDITSRLNDIEGICGFDYEELYNELNNFFNSVRSDNMASEMIYYFPGYQIDIEEEEE